MNDLLQILCGDCREVLKTLPDQSVQCCVTSPPYCGLRDYGVAGQIGLEDTPEAYVEQMVAVMSEVKRVLRDDGVLFLNLGDTYARDPAKGDRAEYLGLHKNKIDSGCHRASQTRTLGKLKPKDLAGVPWMVAFALRDDGWYLRQDIIWHKPSCMPESVTDRCTKAHEYIFLLTKSPTYYFDNEAIKERSEYPDDDRKGRSYDHHKSAPTDERNGVRPRRAPRQNYLDSGRGGYAMRNKRSVWSVTNAGYHEAHFATFPPDLIKPCILAGTKVGDVVLDPFGGSGTTGMVSLELGRKAILIELNESYCELIKQRCNVTPGLPML